jgi:hypothetical protein
MLEAGVKQLIMSLIPHMAKQFRDLHFGGNWTDVDLKHALSDLTVVEVLTKPHGLSSIAALTYHIHYYVQAVLPVLDGGELNASDRFSFLHPEIGTPTDWRLFLEKTWEAAEAFAASLERLPENKLWEPFGDGKYGDYYRNILGVIEHAHYHLGQIVLIKKMIRSGS